MKQKFTLRQLFSIVVVLVLLLAVFAGLSLVKQSQEIRKKASGSVATLAFYPVKDNFQLNETKVFELKATFTAGSAIEKIDYLKTEINFSKDYLLIPSGKYVDTSSTGLDKIFRVDGPQASNDSGKTIIEIGASVPGSGPSTDKPITLAKIYYTGKAKTPSLQDVTIGTTQVVNNQSANIPVTLQGFSYTVGDSANITPTDGSSTPTPTLPPNCKYQQVECIQAPCDPVLVCSNTPTPACQQPVDCANPPPNCRYELGDQCSCGNLVCWEPTPPPISPTPRTGFFFQPDRQHFEIGESKYFEIKASFPKGSSSEKIDYLKTEIKFQLDYLKVPSNMYIDTSTSGLDKILRVDGPVVANQNGTIVIELGAGTPGSGPTTDKEITIARIYFAGKSETPSEQEILLGTTQVINNQSNPIKVTTSGAWYTVGGGNITLPPGEDQYTIPVGSKQWLVINIGPATTPLIRFKAKIARVFNTPDMYFRLRVKDDLAFMNSGTQVASGDSCNNLAAGTTDYYVPVKADKNGVYMPVTQNNASVPEGKKIASVSKDGWILLDGVAPGKYYSIFLKGPKTTGTRMAKHINLQPGQNPGLQDFDWIQAPLQAGDLPDPNNNKQQDCTVNSVDMSLIQRLLGKTDQANLDIADVNYDGVVQGSDLASLVITLATKPDDDN